MAIINCPECQHRVSDKAPVCPNCGVEIVGKIIPCSNCGKIILKESIVCPYCDCNNKQSTRKKTKVNDDNSIKSVKKEPFKRKPNKVRRYVIALIFLLLAGGGACYYYYSNKAAHEQRAFEIAMKSDDKSVLKNYLEDFHDAPQEHIDSIRTHLDRLIVIDEEWMNVKMMRSKQPLQDYLAKYPATKHKGEIENMLDSIDWEQAKMANNNDLYQQYINNHPYGKYADEAAEKIKELKAKLVQPEERDAIIKVIRQFFISVNKRNESDMCACLSNQMTSFLDKGNPSEQDVIDWMNRQYRDDVTEITWQLNNDFNIVKREVGENAYEYAVIFTAIRKTKNSNETSVSENYRVAAIISPDTKLSEMKIRKLA